MKTTVFYCLCLAGSFLFGQKNEVKDSLQNKLISLEEVSVSGLRAKKDQPVTFSQISKEELKDRNLGQDLPILLNFLPAVVTTSDAGAGIGYTGIRVRGSDATRVNVTINGIPYNDAESQGTFWVDLPDFASSVESIQLQRGVGTSTNGSSAFGASLNILTEQISSEAYTQLSNSVGSFGTLRHSLKFSTGKLNDVFEFSGRLGQISSEGYVDRASSMLKSYFFQGSYQNENTLLKAVVFGGHEITYQSWFGVDPYTLETNRTYNYAGEIYSDSGELTGYYDNQVDNYSQDHYQFHWNQQYNQNWSSSVGLNYTYGRGFYEEYNNGSSLENLGLSNVQLGTEEVSVTDNITQKWLDNDFYVLTINAQYENNLSEFVFGGLYSHYDGDHFGRLVWAKFASNALPKHEFYRNKGIKKEASLFAKATHKINRQWTVFSDIQYRNVNYSANGSLNELGTIGIEDSFNFINPKAGISYQANERSQWYFSYAKAQREPNRTDYENGNPRPEKLNDFEAGWRFTSTKSRIETNLYYMRYKDQLVLTGAIDNVGAPIRENIGNSYRMGLEITASIPISNQWIWQPNIALSQNKNLDFKFQRDGNVVDLKNTNIAYSPSFVGASALSFRPNTQFQATLLSKYVSEQYMANIDAPLSKLDAYFTQDLNIRYRLLLDDWIKQIDFSVLVNNVFDQLFVSNGYFYTYDDDYSVPGQITTIEGVGYYPQAGRHFLLGATLGF